ncbi:MAG: hypothetical protein U9R56_03275 [candidate division Zixibacteria bacterium]|nr:hypothetical protein [candidate division Zixibacteria bacterium]
MNIKYNVFDNLGTSLTLNTRRDLSDLDLVNLSFSDFKLGLETDYSQAFSAGYDPKLMGFLTTQLSYKANYSDDWNRSSETRRSTMNRSWGVNGKFDHIAFLGGDGESSKRHFRGRRGNVRGGGSKEKETERPFYDPPLAVLRFLTGWIKAPSYSYSESFKSSVPGMVSRPLWRYRFGLAKEPDVEIVSADRSPSSGESVGYDLSSGFTLFGGLVTDVKFRRSISRDIVKQGSRYENISTDWPDLRIQINKFKSLPLIGPVINRIIDILAPRTAFSRSTRETIDLEGGFTTKKSEDISYSPLLSINFKLFRKLSLTGSYNLSKNKGEKYNSSTGEPQSITQSTQKTMAFSSKYSFSAPGGIGIPMLGKIKFQSTVSIRLNVKINSSLTETSTSGRPFAVSTDKSDFTSSAIISYAFSQQIKGGITTRWQDSNDNYRNRKSHVRELQIWTELKF